MCILFHIPFHHKPYSINNKPYSIMVYHRMLSTFLFKYLFVYLGVLGLSGKIPWRRKGQPTPVFLPGESHGQKSLVDHSLGDCKELDLTEQLSTHTLSQKGHLNTCLQGGQQPKLTCLAGSGPGTSKWPPGFCSKEDLKEKEDLSLSSGFGD